MPRPFHFYIVYFFYVILILSTVYAIRRGGAPERITAWTFLAGAALTLAAAMGFSPIDNRWKHIEWGPLLVDSAMLLVFLWLAFRANRFWTLPMAAFQLLAVTAHFAMGWDPQRIRYTIYWLAVSKISYPMMALLVAGTWLHRRRLKANGADPSWKLSSPPGARPAV